MKNKIVLKRLFSYTNAHKSMTAVSIFCAIISVACGLLIPILIGKTIDYVIGENNVNFLKVAEFMSYIAIATAGSAFFGWGLNLATNTLSNKVALTLRKESFEKVTASPLAYLDNASHGELLNKITNDTDIVATGLAQLYSQFLTGIFTILGTIGFMIFVNFYLSLVVILITPLSIFVAGFIAKKTHTSFLRQSETKGALSSHINEMVSNQKLVAVFGYQEESQAKFEDINQTLYVHGQKSQYYSSLANPSTRFVNNLVYAGVGIIGAVLTISGTLTVGGLTSFLQYANQYTKPFNEITSVVTEIQNALACAGRVFNFIDTPYEAETGDKILKNTDGDIVFDKVKFSYNKDKPLIEDISLTIKKGEKVAIVGQTGCGKTTLINLIMRFYDVDGGSIAIAGQNVNSYTKKSLRQKIGMVLQDSWITGGTVADNIAYGNPSASMEEIKQAGINANADDFIVKLKDGYDTVIGDSDNLSQGQKQLLCIARIMLINPEILILDEATSNIDTRTELKIQKAFAIAMEGKTSFIVAHRLSTIINSDKILVMKDGDVIEVGSHNELLGQQGYYYSLWESQFTKTDTATELA